MSVWYIEKGPESDVVISSRVRLARNLKEYPFPFMMEREDEAKIVNLIKEAFMNNKNSVAGNLHYIDMKNINPTDKTFLVEKHIVSQDLVESQRDRGVLVSMDEKISIMINEEDHLRIQCLFAGMQLDNAWSLCSKIDDFLEESIEMAFDSKFGYLTCCPTNIGTGLRASVMLHLPALTMTGYIKGILEACSKLGIAVRGLYGENSEASGNMYQISNQVTLGQTEEEIIVNIKNVISQIIEQERLMRKEIYRQNPYRLEDKVCRAAGVLSNARIISSEESMKMLSDVRLGVDMGIIRDISIEELNEIMLLIQPAGLQKTAGKQLSPDERDVKRAEMVRNRLVAKDNTQ
jgi:protein arginine kinase